MNVDTPLIQKIEDVSVPGPTSSLPISILSLAATILGACAVTIPYATRVSTPLAFSAVLIFVGLASMLSFSFLIRAMDATSKKTYRELAVSAYGPGMGKFNEVVLVIYTGCGATSGVVLVGDLLPRLLRVWLPHTVWTSRGFVVPVIALAVMLPLSLPRSLGGLRYAALGAIVCLAVTWGVLLASLVEDGDHGELDEVEMRPSVALAFPILIVALMGQYQVCPAYQELENKSPARMYVVVGAATGIAMTVYAAYGAVGFARFGDNTLPDVLNNFATKWKPAIVSRFLLGICVVCWYPLPLFAMRQNLHSLLFGSAPSPAEGGGEVEYGEDGDVVVRIPAVRNVGLTLLCVVITNGLALVTPNVAVVLGFSGGTGGVALMYVLPALFFLKLVPDGGPGMRFLAYVLMVFGVLGGLVSNVVNVLMLCGDRGYFLS